MEFSLCFHASPPQSLSSLSLLLTITSWRTSRLLAPTNNPLKHAPTTLLPLQMVSSAPSAMLSHSSRRDLSVFSLSLAFTYPNFSQIERQDENRRHEPRYDVLRTMRFFAFGFGMGERSSFRWLGRRGLVLNRYQAR